MIRVHCFVSCVCDLLNQQGIDERPFYFGVWDADFALTEQHALSYHCETDHEFFRMWFERLYGVPVVEWYDRQAPKQLNIERLLELLGSRPAHRSIMVMLDMYRLPERENKFNQNPFPHYALLETTPDPERWRMKDPDFRWEGELPRAQVLDAISQPSVAGGYYFDAVGVRPPADAAVKGYFLECLQPHNPLTEAVREVLVFHAGRSGKAGPSGLALGLRELPVLAIRKYAYEHGLAFFWRALGLDWDEFLGWCEEVDKLVKTYTLVQHRALKFAVVQSPALLDDALSLLDAQDALERRIKARLSEVFELWSTGISAAGGPAGAPSGERRRA